MSILQNKIVKGKPQKMKAHLANECLQCPEEISRYLHDRVADRQTNYTRNSDSFPVLPQLKTQITDQYSSDKALPKST